MEPFLQKAKKSRSCPLDRSKIRMPSRGWRKIQLPPCIEAISCSCPAHSPWESALTSQLSPSAGFSGGSGFSPRIVQCTAASIRAKASLTRISFPACPEYMAVLRTAQRFRFAGRIEQGLRAAGPDQPAQRRLETRRAARRRDCEQSAFALDHDRAYFGQGRPHQRNARRGIRLCNRTNPFGTCAGLAETAAGHDQPCPPVARRGKLPGACPEPPMGEEFGLFGLAEFAHPPASLAQRQREQPGQAFTASHRQPCPHPRWQHCCGRAYGPAWRRWHRGWPRHRGFRAVLAAWRLLRGGV